MPHVRGEYFRLYAEEPYRMKCAYILERLAERPRRRAQLGARRPGPHYASSKELLDDLAIMYRSLVEPRQPARR